VPIAEGEDEEEDQPEVEGDVKGGLRGARPEDAERGKKEEGEKKKDKGGWLTLS
jgi:hypothetical protein